MGKAVGHLWPSFSHREAVRPRKASLRGEDEVSMSPKELNRLKSVSSEVCGKIFTGAHRIGCLKGVFNVAKRLREKPYPYKVLGVFSELDCSLVHPYLEGACLEGVNIAMLAVREIKSSSKKRTR